MNKQEIIREMIKCGEILDKPCMDSRERRCIEAYKISLLYDYVKEDIRITNQKEVEKTCQQ